MYPHYRIDENGELVTGNISAEEQRHLTATIAAILPDTIFEETSPDDVEKCSHCGQPIDTD